MNLTQRIQSTMGDPDDQEDNEKLILGFFKMTMGIG